MPPFMGLTSWAAFMTGMKGEAMVMGDLVLMQDEINPVMSAALDNGLQVTALHNHFLFDEPKVYFMHIGGEGSLETLATGVRKALDKVKEVRAANPQPATTFAITSTQRPPSAAPPSLCHGTGARRHPPPTHSPAPTLAALLQPCAHPLLPRAKRSQYCPDSRTATHSRLHFQPGPLASS